MFCTSDRRDRTVGRSFESLFDQFPLIFCPFLFPLPYSWNMDVHSLPIYRRPHCPSCREVYVKKHLYVQGPQEFELLKKTRKEWVVGLVRTLGLREVVSRLYRSPDDGIYLQYAYYYSYTTGSETCVYEHFFSIRSSPSPTNYRRRSESLTNYNFQIETRCFLQGFLRSLRVAGSRTRIVAVSPHPTRRALPVTHHHLIRQRHATELEKIVSRKRIAGGWSHYSVL